MGKFIPKGKTIFWALFVKFGRGSFFLLPPSVTRGIVNEVRILSFGEVYNVIKLGYSPSAQIWDMGLRSNWVSLLLSSKSETGGDSPVPIKEKQPSSFRHQYVLPGCQHSTWIRQSTGPSTTRMHHLPMRVKCTSRPYDSMRDSSFCETAAPKMTRSRQSPRCWIFQKIFPWERAFIKTNSTS